VREHRSLLRRERRDVFTESKGARVMALRKNLTMALFLVLFAASLASANDSEIVEIREKMFIAQTNDVYLNPDEYLGRTIRLAGMFGVIDEVDPPCYYVYRFGPGCCGYDANAGFEVVWKGDGVPYPEDNDWVEATGVLENYEYDGESFLRLALESLVVKADRGLERVEQ
jgi:uncharacterized membrane protein YcgQ (UPF0703/DUF1980 family)